MMSNIQLDMYRDLLLSIQRGTYQGQPINAKPILLLAIFNSIEKGEIVNNKIYFDQIEPSYSVFFHENKIKKTPLFKPFYYLQFDSILHLKWKSRAYEEKHPSSRFIRNNIEYAYFDNALWDILQDKGTRDYFRKSIEDFYLK